MTTAAEVVAPLLVSVQDWKVPVPKVPLAMRLGPASAGPADSASSAQVITP
jgi:hypothetical protein